MGIRSLPYATPNVQVPIVGLKALPSMPNFAPELEAKPYDSAVWGPGIVRYKPPGQESGFSFGCYLCDVGRIRKLDRLCRHLTEEHFEALKKHWLGSDELVQAFMLTLPQYLCPRPNCKQLLFRKDVFQMHLRKTHKLPKEDVTKICKLFYKKQGVLGMTRDYNPEIDYPDINKASGGADAKRAEQVQPPTEEADDTDTDLEQVAPVKREIDEDYDGDENESKDRDGDDDEDEVDELDNQSVAEMKTEHSASVMPVSPTRGSSVSTTYRGGLTGAFRMPSPPPMTDDGMTTGDVKSRSVSLDASDISTVDTRASSPMIVDDDRVEAGSDFDELIDELTGDNQRAEDRTDQDDAMSVAEPDPSPGCHAADIPMDRSSEVRRSTSPDARSVWDSRGG
ncbi:hypothetical protein NM688_g6401 [Phlebia brevispora]|uniref:Uncharacterized protein n=1 Tax=Phlebia brevispora TaxID=194682 RepID=A0ACC1SGR4_9APHY|nr:hypothetical protein NM688_g6401 [Phlebia brevispora]